MARFADVRRAARNASTIVNGGVGTLTRKVTLYGTGIHEGTLHLYAGDTITWAEFNGHYIITATDEDGYVYDVHTPQPLWS